MIALKWMIIAFLVVCTNCIAAQTILSSSEETASKDISSSKSRTEEVIGEMSPENLPIRKDVPIEILTDTTTSEKMELQLNREEYYQDISKPIDPPKTLVIKEENLPQIEFKFE